MALSQKSDLGAALEASGPQPWIADAAKKYMHELGRNDTGVHCLPSGPRAFLGADFVKFIQTPAVTTVLYESMEFRQIFTDGRPLLPDPNPTWMGYSVAWWEGNTLVVTSNGFNDRTFLAASGWTLRGAESHRTVHTPRPWPHDGGDHPGRSEGLQKPAKLVVEAGACAPTPI